MKTKLVSIIMLIVLFLVSCTGCLPKAQQNINPVTPSTTENTATDELQLAEEVKIDINNDHSPETIKLYTFHSEKNNTYEIKLTIDDKSTNYKFEFPTPFNRVEKMQFVNLGTNKNGILIKLYDINNQESFTKANAYNYDYDYGFILFGIIDNEIVTLLDSNKMTFNTEGNYEVKYLDDFDIMFRDNTTGFVSEYSIYYSESLKDEYKNGLEMLESFNISKGMKERYFYQIEVKDIDSDGIDEIICSKYIPGIYHNDVLGVVDYYYKLDNNQYTLIKEVLSYNKALELPPIKEVSF